MEHILNKDVLTVIMLLLPLRSFIHCRWVCKRLQEICKSVAHPEYLELIKFFEPIPSSAFVSSVEKTTRFASMMRFAVEHQIFKAISYYVYTSVPPQKAYEAPFYHVIVLVPDYAFHRFTLASFAKHPSVRRYAYDIGLSYADTHRKVFDVIAANNTIHHNTAYRACIEICTTLDYSPYSNTKTIKIDVHKATDYVNFYADNNKLTLHSHTYSSYKAINNHTLLVSSMSIECLPVVACTALHHWNQDKNTTTNKKAKSKGLYDLYCIC